MQNDKCAYCEQENATLEIVLRHGKLMFCDYDCLTSYIVYNGPAKEET